MNGVVVIDKPKGCTSHDVVARVRRMLRIKKAGHGGTLDPLATGVLPVYLGEGTKLVPFNLEGTKEYRAVMRLGQETDTQDADGAITSESGDLPSGKEEIENILVRFRGPIRQVPPVFSAIKREGVPLYKMARAGGKPEVAARNAFIHSLLLQEVDLPLATLEVSCSRGTYIRTLCADIGRALGCGAHLSELRRLRSGKFTLEQAFTLEELSVRAGSGRMAEAVIPLREGIDMPEAIRVKEIKIPDIRRGRPVPLSDLPEEKQRALKKGQRVCLLDARDELLAIAEAGGEDETAGALRILRVFHC